MRSFSIFIYRTFSIQFYVVVVMSATFLSLLSSCQKEESNNQPGFSSNIIEQKVTTWLDSKSKAYSISNDHLKNELQYSKLFQKKLNDEGKFIVIPLKESHFETSPANKNKSFTALQIIEDKAGNIIEGNVVQYFSKDHIDESAVPENFFQLYINKSPAMRGEFSFLTLSGKLLYNMNYDKDGLRSSGFVSPRKKTVTANRIEQDPIQDYASCIDWYLVTTYIYPDGSTSQTSQYVYTTCPVSGGGGSSGSGSGNTEEVYEYVVIKERYVWTFEVCPPNSPSSSGVTVYSEERLKGKRVAGNLAGGVFTSITHMGSGLFPPSFGLWIELDHDVNFSGSTASSRVYGRYVANYVDGVYRWYGGDTENITFNQVF